MGLIFRRMREEKGLLNRQVAAVTELDQAIISRIENGDRIPTKEQVLKLAGLYNLDTKEIMSAWLAEKMVRDYGTEPYVTEAFREAHDKMIFYNQNINMEMHAAKARIPESRADNQEKNKDQDRKPGRKPGKSDK
ncbi:MAG: helix-turn-helix transcriptional regulator [Bacteroidales bacterium]|nr:helix-turn-helix transcriptional regulator [Bacteroidales bacterium]